MLQTAIAAQIPLIAARTTDTLNLPEVLRQISGKTPRMFKSGEIIQKDTLYYFVVPLKKEMDTAGIYKQMMERESVLIVVNPPRIDNDMFDAGLVPVPRELMYGFIHEVLGEEAKVPALIRALGGVTIKQASELLRLTMAREKSLTPHGLMATRRQFFQGQEGLTLVDPDQQVYFADPQLIDWLARESGFFLSENVDPRLIPRGLLFDGPPGVGKTSGAKYVASCLEVPLYRFDVGGTKNKYVGASEANMISNLSRIDAEAPCVVLFDEVEKVFDTGRGFADGNTTTSMMSQLLWWLAEHKSKVLSIMTTNARQRLPRELWREGRVDELMVFQGLTFKPAMQFVQVLLDSFGEFKHTDPSLIVSKAMEVSKLDTDPVTVSQAALTKMTYTFVKSQGMSLGKFGNAEKEERR